MNASHRRGDLDDIITAIREVEVNLDRRSARAAGVSMMAWAIAASSIFTFYHLVERNPEPFGALLGTAGIRWAWVGPMALGYLVNVMVGARLGRIAPDARPTAGIRRMLVILLLPLSVLIFVSVTGRGDEFMPAMWVAFLGATFLAFCGGQLPRVGRLFRVVGWGSLAAGALLAILAPSWGAIAAAIWYLVGLGGIGLVRYHAGE